MGIVIGAVAGIWSVFLVHKKVGWTNAFGIPTGAMPVAFIVFIAGIEFYRREGRPPAPNCLTKLAQVLVAALRKCRAARDRWGILAWPTTICC